MKSKPKFYRSKYPIFLRIGELSIHKIFKEAQALEVKIKESQAFLILIIIGTTALREKMVANYLPHVFSVFLRKQNFFFYICIKRLKNCGNEIS